MSNEAKRLLALRRKHKATKPEFVRQESWRYVRLDESWRRPRGKDSKMRLRVKGWPKIVKVGYGSPRKTEGLHPSGLKPILISSKRDLEKAGSPEGKILILSSKLGRRLKEALAKEAFSRGFVIANYETKAVKTKEA
ncbi:MAG: 50S ribosomal protein L32e [Crenarchaeota archaeon]|nr:50S ribosomal protein L32e [Thermoproteota archaeon]MDW8033831.1 50S ribosomal protein L32e [Nitrososphaerota archaeon]